MMTNKPKRKTSALKPEEFFYLLSDPTRLRCLILMQQKGELCVCDLTSALKMIQPKISRHLSLLRQYNIVKDRRAGIWIYYQINPQLAAWAKEVLRCTANALIDTKLYSSDLKAVEASCDRANCCD